MKKIDVNDIRKGDKIRYEYSEHSANIAHEYTAMKDGDFWVLSEGQHYLMERPYALPTEDGIYMPLFNASLPYYAHDPVHRVYGAWSSPARMKNHEETVRWLTEGKIELMRLVPEKRD